MCSVMAEMVACLCPCACLILCGCCVQSYERGGREAVSLRLPNFVGLLCAAPRRDGRVAVGMHSPTHCASAVCSAPGNLAA